MSHFEPGACLSLWPTRECEWSIADVLRWSDLIQLAIYLSVVLMLFYTFYVVIRFLFRYRVARRELPNFELKSGSGFPRSKRAFIADLSRGLRTLLGIAYAAPFLALAGTGYGILAAPSWYGHIRGTVVHSLTQDLAATLINTALGILVALSATISHNLLRTRIETLSLQLGPQRDSGESSSSSSQFAQTLRLKRRLSSLPQFALIAAPVLAFLVMEYLAFKPYPPPTGLHVKLLPMGSLDRGDDSAKPVVVAVLSRVNGIPVVRVNSEEIPWDRLEEVAREKLQHIPEAVAFVEADEGVLWNHVAYVIVTLKHLRYRVVLLTASPAPAAKDHRRFPKIPKIPVAPIKPLR